MIGFVRNLEYNTFDILYAKNGEKAAIRWIMEYLSIKQTSEKWEISVQRIQTLCTTGRIPGAQKIGYAWIIPADAEKPADARVKSGKYRKADV